MARRPARTLLWTVVLMYGSTHRLQAEGRCGTPATGRTIAPVAVANDNRVAAGRLRDGVLEVALVARAAIVLIEAVLPVPGPPVITESRCP